MGSLGSPQPEPDMAKVAAHVHFTPVEVQAIRVARTPRGRRTRPVVTVVSNFAQLSADIEAKRREVEVIAQVSGFAGSDDTVGVVWLVGGSGVIDTVGSGRLEFSDSFGWSLSGGDYALFPKPHTTDIEVTHGSPKFSVPVRIALLYIPAQLVDIRKGLEVCGIREHGGSGAGAVGVTLYVVEVAKGMGRSVPCTLWSIGAVALIVDSRLSWVDTIPFVTGPVMLLSIPLIIRVSRVDGDLQICFYLFISAGSESNAGISLGNRAGDKGYRIMNRVFDTDAVVCTRINNHCGAVGGVSFSAGDGEVVYC